MKLNTQYAALGALILASASASAATVSFSAADYSDGLVSTNGTLVGALNATTAETVNGVSFEALGVNAGTVPLTGGVDVTVFGGASTGTGVNGTAGALTSGGTFSSVNNGNINFTVKWSS